MDESQMVSADGLLVTWGADGLTPLMPGISMNYVGV